MKIACLGLSRIGSHTAALCAILSYQTTGVRAEVREHPPLILAEPVGVAVLPLSDSFNAIATPFDAQNGLGLSGVDLAYAWDATTQTWRAFAFDGETWKDETGSAMPLLLAGDAVVPGKANDTAKAVLTGKVPMRGQREKSFAPGLNLAGDPYNLQRNPLQAAWSRLSDEQDTLVFWEAPDSIFAKADNGNAPRIKVEKTSAELGTVQWTIDPGPCAGQLILILAAQWTGGPLTSNLNWTVVGEFNERTPVSWVEEWIEAPRELTVYLYTATPSVDSDHDGVADAVEALVLRTDPNSPARTEVVELGTLEDTLAARLAAEHLANANLIQTLPAPSSVKEVIMHTHGDFDNETHSLVSGKLREQGLGHIASAPMIADITKNRLAQAATKQ